MSKPRLSFWQIWNMSFGFLGIFNFFIVLPEIAASLGFGLVMKHLLGGNRLAAVLLGGVCLVIAALLVQRVKEVHPTEGQQ